jgi:hypothetical protein
MAIHETGHTLTKAVGFKWRPVRLVKKTIEFQSLALELRLDPSCKCRLAGTAATDDVNTWHFALRRLS